MNKISNVLVLGLLAVLLSGSYVGYLSYSNKSGTDEIAKVGVRLQEFQKDELKNKNQEVLAAITAQRSVNSLTTGLVKWSKVIRDVRATVPKVKGKPLIDVLSYSGAQDGGVSLNVKTLSGSTNPYLDVAEVIATFVRSANFENVFVPSISSGLDKDGNQILSFAISTNYIASPEVEVVVPTAQAIQR